ncbi:MAG: UDP-N-acetyl glucosamine 2-epimerase [Pseudobdellovibrio sp.]
MAHSVDGNTLVNTKKKISFVLGIRPDIIRAALIIKYLKKQPNLDVELVWSGQHYSDNLKDIFFRELDIPAPDVELGCAGATDAEIASALITKLYAYYVQNKPDVAVFLGDTNTTTGAIACAQLNIPIYHIEGCMRSYDWQMPEEKYRTMIDHLSDLIYTYFDEYKAQGVAEGLNPNRIVVVGNPIVDIVNEYYFSRKKEFDEMLQSRFFLDRNLTVKNYFVMTCHRRENVHNDDALARILELVKNSPLTVYFPASYRTQQVLKDKKFVIPSNLKIVDPVGYRELLCLMVNSKGVVTDSGTLVEESAVLGIPSIQMRHSTERPQVYDCRSSVKFDPRSTHTNYTVYFSKLLMLEKTAWKHGLGDGQTSQKIAEDLVHRAQSGTFSTRKREQYHISTERAYQGDKL